MKMIRTALIVGIAAMLGVVPAHAACPASVDDASAATPHLLDGTNDYPGVVTGSESGTVPYADIYREGTDLTNVWLAREDGVLRAHIQVQQMAAAQPNSAFYFRWEYVGTDEALKDRFVSAKLKGYGVDYTYGYLGPPNAAGVQSFITEGSTTGALLPESSEVIIDLPTTGASLSGAPVTDWGAPAPGSVLGLLVGEARVLIGSPEPLPPNPSGIRSGLVGVADDTTDAIDTCDAAV